MRSSGLSLVMLAISMAVVLAVTFAPWALKTLQSATTVAYIEAHLHPVGSTPMALVHHWIASCLKFVTALAVTVHILTQRIVALFKHTPGTDIEHRGRHKTKWPTASSMMTHLYHVATRRAPVVPLRN